MQVISKREPHHRFSTKMSILVRFLVVALWCLVSCLVLQSVSAINCYICVSKKSWKDCEYKTKTMNCSSSSGMEINVCVSFFRQVGNRTTFIRRCGNSEKCKNIESSCRGHGLHCDAVQCCSTDLCNHPSSSPSFSLGSPHHSLSFSLLCACALVVTVLTWVE